MDRTENNGNSRHNLISRRNDHAGGQPSLTENQIASTSMLYADAYPPDSRSLWHTPRLQTDTWAASPAPTMAPARTRKKRHISSTTNTSAHNASTSNANEVAADLGRRVKVKHPVAPASSHSPYPRLLIAPDSNAGASSTSNRHQVKEKSDKKRHRSPSRDAHSQVSRRPGTVESGKGKDKECIVVTETQSPEYSGPLAVAEFERMKKEIETLKKAVHSKTRDVKKQSQLINELRDELSAGSAAKREQETQLRALKAKSKKNEELITAIETSLQCQICMEILNKPFALAPCGHILCLTCLREWFRKAPPSADDMDDLDDDLANDPEYIMKRPKSCPCCRAVIMRRPVPVFVVKAVTTALIKAKGAGDKGGGSSSSQGNNTSSDNEDPWRGLFPPVEEEDEECYSEDDDENHYDDDEAMQDLDGWDNIYAGFGAFGHHAYSSDSNSNSNSNSNSASEDDSESGESEYGLYAAAQWEPPRLKITWFDFPNLDEEVLKMMQRGCTLEMINFYQMEYTHEEGLVAHVGPFYFEPYDPSNDNDDEFRNRIFLGWNVELREDDDDGATFMGYTFHDIKYRPDRWDVQPRMDLDNAFDAKRLVKIGELNEYATTDTEAWFEMGDTD